MKKSASSSRIFYQAGYLSAEVLFDEKRSFLRFKELPLAERELRAAGGMVSLLAIDAQHSITKNSCSRFISYTPYGYSLSGCLAQSLLGFSGMHRQLNNCYFSGDGYRTYSTSLMRFNSPDSFSPFDAGGVNSYSYCIGDPINYTDASGHMRVRPQRRSPDTGLGIAQSSKPIVRSSPQGRERLNRGVGSSGGDSSPLTAKLLGIKDAIPAHQTRTIDLKTAKENSKQAYANLPVMDGSRIEDQSSAKRKIKKFITSETIVFMTAEGLGLSPNDHLHPYTLDQGYQRSVKDNARKVNSFIRSGSKPD